MTALTTCKSNITKIGQNTENNFYLTLKLKTTHAFDKFKLKEVSKTVKRRG